MTTLSGEWELVRVIILGETKRELFINKSRFKQNAKLSDPTDSILVLVWMSLFDSRLSLRMRSSAKVLLPCKCEKPFWDRFASFPGKEVTLLKAFPN